MKTHNILLFKQLLLQRQCRETPEKMSKTAEGNAGNFALNNLSFLCYISIQQELP